jgi:phosphoribosyl-AMP cyclohydrolase
MNMNVFRPNFEKRGGLVVVIVQEVITKNILMQAYTDEAGYLETVRTGKAVYWSTKREERWCKGETSGNFQKVVDILVDCDGDSLIYLVTQLGEGACHTGAHSCFYRRVTQEEPIMAAPEAGDDERLRLISTEVHSNICGDSPTAPV